MDDSCRRSRHRSLARPSRHRSTKLEWASLLAPGWVFEKALPSAPPSEPAWAFALGHALVPYLEPGWARVWGGSWVPVMAWKSVNLLVALVTALEMWWEQLSGEWVPSSARW